MQPSLLNDAKFRKTYRDGGFAPQEIEEYGIRHRIFVNRFSPGNGMNH